ncbi:hypothetical protein DH2020_044566 [Rehmannia glutinosa]|uniref:Low-temperature-induced 65 kDa protein n=1 Tax=Rehmannia glutinosa TaxID=99300 RepID=A0ABR0UHD0_REHGL
MEAQLQRPTHGHHHYDEDPQHAGLHSVIEGEGEQGEHHHHGEKKSVLKKVKDKAKKIKDTIKKHGHGHEHEHEVYESTVMRSINLPKETNIRDDKHKHNIRDEGITRPVLPLEPELSSSPAMEARKPDKLSVEEPKIRIGPPVGLEEDPHSPKNSPAQIPPSNYQSKVADPTGAGGKEAEVAPLISQFDNLKFHHDSSSKPQLQQRSEQTPTKNQSNPESNPLGTPESNPETQDPAQDTLAGKISSATSAVATTAISAKNAVASKLGYGSGPQGEGGQEYSSGRSASEVASEYAGKVYEKIAGAGGGETAAYLAEKFRPGDEDKALSEVITDAFHRKEATAVEKPGWKVTESEEVAARLGTAVGKKREGEDALAAGAESSGEGMVERVKDAFGSWLGKSAGVQTAAQDSIGGSYAFSLVPQKHLLKEVEAMAIRGMRLRCPDGTTKLGGYTREPSRPSA